jgi:DNA-binding Lrp family transcriptional regulator
MDAVDRLILQQLATNCRITYQELATLCQRSANAVKKRVKKLEDTGIITGYRVSLSQAMTGTNQLFGMLATDGSQDETEFVTALGQNEKIMAAASYTGGNYALVAEFRDSQDLWDIGAFLRSFESVRNIETHQLLIDRGSIIELSNPHLRVLKRLVKDPRMSIVDIAEESGLTARRVRKLVNDLVQSKAVRFGAFLELGAGESIPFLMWINWDEHATNYRIVSSWLREIFSSSVWDIFISAEQPIMIILFTGENLTVVDDISQQTRFHEHITKVTVQIAKYHNYFPSLGAKYLRQLIEAVD